FPLIGLVSEVLFLAIAMGSLAFWRRRRARRRIFPFKDRERFLRQPGETLRKRVGEFEEQIVTLVVLGLITPMLCLSCYFTFLGSTVQHVHPVSTATVLWQAALALLIPIIVISIRLVRT